jgi:tetratricopeptide (TPR) repeat protein
MRPSALLVALVATLPGALAAQPVAHLGGSLPQADLLYFAGKPREAFAVLERHIELHAHDYEALWRAARAAVLLGLAEETIERQNAWLDPGIVLGDRAVAERPTGLDGLYWRGAAAGRRAINAGPSYSADLAQRVYDDAHAILELDPDHGGAHNLLGRLNYEIMSLSSVERFFGRVLVRSQALRDSSWETAESELRAAADAWPEMVPFRFDLAQLYRKRGREEEARRALHQVTEMVPLHPLDASLQEDARRQLAELGS